MTKDEADARVREAEQEVIRCAKSFGEKFETQSGVHAAVTKLLEAEAARAALDKPRLPDADRLALIAVSANPLGGAFEAAKTAIHYTKTDILAQAEKLPRLASEHLSGRYCDYTDAIFLSDLRNLIQGT